MSIDIRFVIASSKHFEVYVGLWGPSLGNLDSTQVYPTILSCIYMMIIHRGRESKPFTQYRAQEPKKNKDERNAWTVDPTTAHIKRNEW
jgi:hypothetical protein